MKEIQNDGSDHEGKTWHILSLRSGHNLSQILHTKYHGFGMVNPQEFV